MNIGIDMTQRAGADLVIDTAGGTTLMQSIGAVRQGGSVFALGFIGGSKLELDLMPLMLKSVRLQGSNTGSSADLTSAMQVIAAHRIAPIIDSSFAIDDVAGAYSTMPRGGRFGKVAIRLDW